MHLRLSIVVPILDEDVALPRLLDHLRAQCGPGSGCSAIFVDGGSSDTSLELLRAAGVLYIEADRGRAQQMNAGAAATDGDVLLFLHADTQMPTGWANAVRDAIRDGHVGGFFRVRLQSARPLLRLTGWLISRRSRLTGIATGDQAIFVARDAFDDLGGYAPLPLFEDVELARRLKARGSVASLGLTVQTSARRWERLGTARTILRMWLLRALYWAGVRPDRLARYYEATR